MLTNCFDTAFQQLKLRASTMIEGEIATDASTSSTPNGAADRGLVGEVFPVVR